MSIRVLKQALLATLVAAAWCVAQDDMEPYGPQPTREPEAKAQYEANLKAHKGDDNFLVLPGLVADRRARTVEIMAEATGLAGDELAEFLLIDKGSSHGYEAILWSHAKPSDVHKALQFIGLRPSTPRNPAVVRLFSDGDRVSVGLRETADDIAIPIEQLILDKETGETLPEDGFVFSGSIVVPPRGGTGDVCYAADIYDPRSVASVYNEPTAVLDVPRQAAKMDVYGNLVVNSDMPLQHGEMLTVVMEPRDREGRPAAPEYTLGIGPSTNAPGFMLRLTDGAGKVVAQSKSPTKALEPLVSDHEEDTVPVLQMTFADELPVARLGRLSAFISVLESMGMVRVKPPSAHELYYRAFVPEKSWAEPSGRPTQPWELHLSRSGTTVSGRMEFHDPVYSDGNPEPTFKTTVRDVATPADFKQQLKADAAERIAAGHTALPSVLLVFVDEALTYGEMMQFLKPVLETHGTVYVFVDRK